MRRSAFLLATMFGVACAAVSVPAPKPQPRVVIPNPPMGVLATFDITGSTARAFAALWKDSYESQVERVACLQTEIEPLKPGAEWGHLNRVILKAVAPITVSRADSLSASAVESIELCGPEYGWNGTVHTHPHDSPLFKETFSPSDRAVIAMWRDYWNQDGVFCVIYSATTAYCEASSPLMNIAGRITYQGPPPGLDLTQPGVDHRGVPEAPGRQTLNCMEEFHVAQQVAVAPVCRGR